jgi:hypothetical protein
MTVGLVRRVSEHPGKGRARLRTPELLSPKPGSDSSVKRNIEAVAAAPTPCVITREQF